jgi:hypothetical protein
VVFYHRKNSIEALHSSCLIGIRIDDGFLSQGESQALFFIRHQNRNDPISLIKMKGF